MDKSKTTDRTFTREEVSKLVESAIELGMSIQMMDQIGALSDGNFPRLPPLYDFESIRQYREIFQPILDGVLEREKHGERMREYFKIPE